MKSLKKDVNLEEGTGLARENVTLRCGDCLHYQGTYHPAMDKPCVQLGVRTSAIAPGCYTPNVALFRKIPGVNFKTLALTLTSFKPQQARVLMGLLKCSGSLERTGLHFLQKIYFRVGEDFLENYYSGFVLGLGPQKTIMIVGERYLAGSGSAPVAQLMRSSIMTWSQFKKRKERCINHGLILEPKKVKSFTKEDYEPPTIDNPPEEQQEKKSKKRTFTVVDETRVKSV